jgi:hypothetical protein
MNTLALSNIKAASLLRGIKITQLGKKAQKTFILFNTLALSNIKAASLLWGIKITQLGKKPKKLSVYSNNI